MKRTDLNINLWFIKWGYMNGYLSNEKVEKTKSCQNYQWICIIINSLNLIFDF